ncbi:hypothetical protein ACIOK4_13715 [Streptomyces bottropensis]|uniref:hypothetical protein n=1 Tax=Streptomyces bottropensis TaxID=42235 RepID=UPI003800003E
MKCGHWIGADRRHCRTVDGVRHFLTGMRCPAHTPAALAGKPEAPATGSLPARALAPSPISASHVADDRAVASGKRRSNPQTYRASQAAVNRKDKPTT